MRLIEYRRLDWLAWEAKTTVRPHVWCVAYGPTKRSAARRLRSKLTKETPRP